MTLGTGTRTLAEFISLLKRLEVKVAVDVRRFPTSRFEHFKKEKLAKSLSEAGVRYYDLGAELGGYRKEGYQTFVTSEEFLCGLEKLKNNSSCGQDNDNLCREASLALPPTFYCCGARKAGLVGYTRHQ